MVPIVDFENRHERLTAVFEREATFGPEVDAVVRAIVEAVRKRGDAALLDLTERYDGVRPQQLRVPEEALDRALRAADDALMHVVEKAAVNIRRFHERQVRQSWFAADPGGVVLGQRIVPVDRAGLYVPGGTAAYPSSVLMNVIPAQVAGVARVQLASPPGPDGLPHPLVLATARLLGLDEVYAVGGAQAIVAMAYGTETVPRVDVIAGPGNVYVAAAKKEVFGRVGIDSIAGPSEIVVLADDTADARLVAADMLSQAEHDVHASAILVTWHRPLAQAVQAALQRLVPSLPRRDIVVQSLARYGACIVAPSMEAAIQTVDELAPEHLEIVTREPWEVMGRVRHAGAIFLGPNAAEPVGDYLAGPNHVLPTGGTARFASALGVDDFTRRQSIIAYTEQRLRETGPDVVRFARAEQLDAHARAIQARLDRMEEPPDRS